MTRYLEIAVIIVGLTLVAFAAMFKLAGDIDHSTNCIAWAACSFAMFAGLRK